MAANLLLIVRMIAIACLSAAIEFCFAVECVFLSPLLLKLGVPVYLMTMTWAIGPVLGVIVTPLLGAVSDSVLSVCLGRRGPFVLLYSIGALGGIILLAYSKVFGVILGDAKTEVTGIASEGDLQNGTSSYNNSSMDSKLEMQTATEKDYKDHLYGRLG